MNEHVESFNQIKTAAIDLAIKFGPKVFVAIAIMVGGYFAGRWVGKVMARGLQKFDLEPPVRDLLVRIVRIVVLGLFAIMALPNLGVDLLPLIAGIGVAGAGNEINKALVEIFRGKSISIPFPQREIRMLGNAG